MNNLMTESFERIRGRYPGESDVESGSGFSPDSRDMGMKVFFEKVAEIEKQIESISTHLQKLQATNEESYNATKASTMKALKEQMKEEVEDVKLIALKIKTSLEELDRDNLASRKKQGCEKGTGVDRSRTSMTEALRKKLKERMSQFQILRQNIHDEYRQVVERRVFTVTGVRPDEETIDTLIETGNSEQIFEQAIQGHGRGQIMDTLAEIQERRDVFLEIEQRLLDLQQMFLDMSVMVDAQGDMTNNIENQVTNSIEHVKKATATLQKTKKLQKSTRKWSCIAILILLLIVAVVLVAVFKASNQS